MKKGTEKSSNMWSVRHEKKTLRVVGLKKLLVREIPCTNCASPINHHILTLQREILNYRHTALFPLTLSLRFFLILHIGVCGGTAMCYVLCMMREKNAVSFFVLLHVEYFMNRLVSWIFIKVKYLFLSFSNVWLLHLCLFPSILFKFF